MIYNAKGRKIDIEDFTINYIEFGKGKKNLIIIPGGGDGLKTVKGMTIPLTLMYKMFAKEYKVYIPSRRNEIKEGTTIKDMAEEIAKLMDKLNIKDADVIGVSQGGMIAQELTINYPEKVKKLILIVTAPKTNPIIQESLNGWIKSAKKNEYKSIFIDTAERSYTEKKLKSYRKMYNIMSKLTKPKSLKRFIIQMEAILKHDTYDRLDRIKNKTLIIGAEKDRIVGVEASKQLHEKITNSELYIYADYSHAVYEEAKGFNNKIMEFLNK